MGGNMKSSFKSKVRFSEVDMDCKLSFGKILDYLQDCSNFQSDSLGIGIDYQMKTNRAWILRSWRIDINGVINNNDEIITTTWPIMFRRGYGKRNFTIAMEQEPEKYLVKAESVWIIFDMEAKSLTKIEDKDIEKYECEAPLEMNPIEKRIGHGDDYEQMEEYIVHKYHLDVNNHMNNSWYIKIAEEYVEHKEDIQTIRVEYKKSAKLGDTIIPYVCYDGKRYLIELRSKDEEVYAITEFIKK